MHVHCAYCILIFFFCFHLLVNFSDSLDSPSVPPQDMGSAVSEDADVPEERRDDQNDTQMSDMIHSVCKLFFSHLAFVFVSVKMQKRWKSITKYS